MRLPGRAEGMAVSHALGPRLSALLGSFPQLRRQHASIVVNVSAIGKRNGLVTVPVGLSHLPRRVVIVSGQHAFPTSRSPESEIRGKRFEAIMPVSFGQRLEKPKAGYQIDQVIHALAQQAPIHTNAPPGTNHSEFRIPHAVRPLSKKFYGWPLYGCVLFASSLLTCSALALCQRATVFGALLANLGPESDNTCTTDRWGLGGLEWGSTRARPVEGDSATEGFSLADRHNAGTGTQSLPRLRGAGALAQLQISGAHAGDGGETAKLPRGPRAKGWTDGRSVWSYRGGNGSDCLPAELAHRLDIGVVRLAIFTRIGAETRLFFVASHTDTRAQRAAMSLSHTPVESVHVCGAGRSRLLFCIS